MSWSVSNVIESTALVSDLNLPGLSCDWCLFTYACNRKSSGQSTDVMPIRDTLHVHSPWIDHMQCWKPMNIPCETYLNTIPVVLFLNNECK